MNEPIDFFVVSTCQNEYFGPFIFTKTVLCEHGVLSKDGKGGNRAMRVYPPWDKKNADVADGLFFRDSSL